MFFFQFGIPPGILKVFKASPKILLLLLLKVLSPGKSLAYYRLRTTILKLIVKRFQKYDYKCQFLPSPLGQCDHELFVLLGLLDSGRRLLRSLKFILALFRSDQDRSNVSKYTNNENYNFIRVIQSKREVPKCFMPTRPMVGINIINTILNSISGQDYSIPGGDKTPVERQHHPETEARQDSQSDQD